MSSSWRESNHDSSGCPILTSDDFFLKCHAHRRCVLSARTVRSPVNCIFGWEHVHIAAVSVSCELCDNQVLSYKPGFNSADMTQWHKWVMTPAVLNRAYRIMKIMLSFDVQL